MVDKIKMLDVSGMFIGISMSSGCWKNPMNVEEIMEDDYEEK